MSNVMKQSHRKGGLMAEADELLTVDEVAERVKVNPETVRRWIKSGRLPAAKPAGGPYRIHSTDLDRLFGPPPKVEAPTSPELSPETVSEEERRVTELLGSWGRHIERRAQAWEQQAAAEHKPYFGDWAGALQWGSDVSEEALEIFESAEEVASALVKEGAAVGEAVQELQRLEESYSRMWESIRAVGRRVSQALDTFTDQLKDTRSLARVRQARAWAEKEEEKRQERYEERLSRQVDAAEAG